MPALWAIDVASKKKYKCETKPTDLTVDIIDKWANDVFDGAIKPDFKSEDIPQPNDDPVTVVVGKNF